MEIRCLKNEGNFYWDEGFNSVTQDGGFLFANSMPEWILDKDCDWRDSIEYRRDAV